MRLKSFIFARLHNGWHFLLLIIFFITHGYAEHTGMIPVGDLLLLLAGLLVFGILLYFLTRIFIKDKRKAALFVTFFLTLFLFFGAFQDLFGTYRATARLAQLRVFVPVSLGLIVVAFAVLRWSKYKFTKLTIFLNAVLALYIIVDIGVIGFKLLSPAESKTKEFATYGLNATPCDTCKRPSIYFIIMDEYSGSTALKGHFNYDNSAFEQYLKDEGFKVVQNPSSNYVFTIYSMASTLNMSYISELGKQSMTNHFGYRKAGTLIADNVVTKFLQAQGYAINNYSYLPIPGGPVEYKADYLPADVDLITNKTMYSRVSNNLMLFLGRKFSIKKFKRRRDDFYIGNNEKMMSRVIKESSGDPNITTPTFTYMHLLMPHGPFAYDSLGRRTIPAWEKKNMTEKDINDDYLQYLVYTNNRMRSFISSLKANSKGQAVIILMGDHGYRRTPNNWDWGYNTLNAVYLPDKNYDQWYDGMTNVNQFRALFNTLFKQNLPMLKDSLVR